MEQGARRYYGAFDQAKVIGNVLVKVFGNDFGMPGGYGFRSVDVRIQTRKIHVFDLFVSFPTMIEFGSVGSPAV